MSQMAKREALNRERVLRAAMAVADSEGLDALSMRRLGQELGVEAMSVYNHVRNKDDLVGGMLELVSQEVQLPADELDWRGALRARTVSAHQAFIRHPWAAQIWMSGPISPTSTRIAQSDAVLRCLREGGLSPQVIYSAYHALDGYALGYALQRASFPFSRAQLNQMAKAFLEEFSPTDNPEFAEHIRQHGDPAFTSTDSFEFGLDLILDGLERLSRSFQDVRT